MNSVLKETSPQADARSELRQLLERVAAADRQAFQALYAATKAKLFGVILRIIYNPDDASEVLQEAYLRIWNNAGDYTGDRGAPMTWMIAIARNRALDWRRRLRVELVPFDDEIGQDEHPDHRPDPMQQAMSSAEARRLGACMDELETLQQQCLLMTYREGLTHQELAERLDRPLGTIKSWIRRGLGKLKDCLER